MASVFLSYVREDAEKARALAAIIERAGHSVWWDRRIKGGAQYSTEIEAALNAADRVVVLWSAKSVGSAWVRDEAAAGRDTDRLVPVSLDKIQPPLGFRQFQTIDLSAWKGRSQPDQLLESLGDRGAPPRELSAAIPRKLGSAFGFPRLAVVAASLIIPAIAGGGWWWANRAGAHSPTVAAEGVDDRSREIARQLTLRLSELQSARGDTFKLTAGSASADLIVQINVGDSPEELRRDFLMTAARKRRNIAFENPT